MLPQVSKHPRTLTPFGTARLQVAAQQALQELGVLDAATQRLEIHELSIPALGTDDKACRCAGVVQLTRCCANRVALEISPAYGRDQAG